MDESIDEHAGAEDRGRADLQPHDPNIALQGGGAILFCSILVLGAAGSGLIVRAAPFWFALAALGAVVGLGVLCVRASARGTLAALEIDRRRRD